MSLFGQLADVALVDLVQILHISKKSGTLFLEFENQAGKIYLKDGNISGAISPNLKQNLGDILVKEKFCSASDVQEAAGVQKMLLDYKPLGALLVEKGKISFEQLKDAISMQIKLSLMDLISWKEGSFYFEIGEPDILDEIAYIPEELFPSLNFDTHHLLLEAVRIFDETNSKAGVVEEETSLELDSNDDKLASNGIKPLTAAEFDLRQEDLHSIDEGTAFKHQELVVFVSNDSRLHDQIYDAWKLESFHPLVVAEPQRALLKIEELVRRDSDPLVIVDMDEGEEKNIKLIRWVRQRLPKVEILVVSSKPSFNAQQNFISEGARSVLLKPGDMGDEAQLELFLDLCRQVISRHFQSKAIWGMAHGSRILRNALSDLKERMGELKGTSEKASVALMLLDYISGSIDRAILFLRRKKDLIALGAFGQDHRGEALTSRVASLRIAMKKQKSFIGELLASARPFSGKLDEVSLKDMEHLYDIIGAPITNEVLFIPLSVEERTELLVYGDNGKQKKPLVDSSLIEILASQASIVLENSELKQRLGE